MDIDDLVGTYEIAERLDVGHQQTINTWRHRHPDFPPPALRLHRVNLWLWPDVEAWARETGRLTD